MLLLSEAAREAMAAAGPAARQRRASGQAMVEFAIVIMLFLGMVVGVLEGARLVASYFVIGNAARDGARAGLYITATDADIQAKANQAAQRVVGTIPSTDNTITICRRAQPAQACGSTPLGVGSVVDVTVTHNFRFLPFAGGWLGQASVMLTGFHRAVYE